MKKCIYILLPVHNRREITRDFIDCLAKQTWQNYHLVLIDDGSTDGTEQMVRERVENLTVIRGYGDWWWAGCLQQGFNFLKKEGLSHDDYVLIINDDVVFGKDFLTRGISILDKNKQTLLLAQFQEGKNSPPQETGIHADLRTLSFPKASSSSDIKTSPDVIVSQNLHETRKVSLDNSSYFCYLGSFFSIKSYYNPIYQISFIFLACPVRWIPRNLLRILFMTLRIIFKYPVLKLKKMLASLR
jgi:glycosyltransferase involved in cell wall biosynthesis